MSQIRRDLQDLLKYLKAASCQRWIQPVQHNGHQEFNATVTDSIVVRASSNNWTEHVSSNLSDSCILCTSVAVGKENTCWHCWLGNFWNNLHHISPEGCAAFGKYLYVTIHPFPLKSKDCGAEQVLFCILLLINLTFFDNIQHCASFLKCHFCIESGLRLRDSRRKPSWSRAELCLAMLGATPN